MSELKLKPCPFCGGSNIDIQTDDCGLSWYVFCNDCGAMCGYSMTKDDVISAWDKRAEKEKINDDSISRQAAIDAINHICPVDTGYDCVLLDKVDVRYVLSELPSAQPERLTDDDFETIRIHLSAYKEQLANQRRWKEAEEYQKIIDRFISFASAQPEIIKCEDCRYANECHKSVQYTRNEPNSTTIGYSPIEWCSKGERKANGDC